MITLNPAYSNINFKSYQHTILNKSGGVINRGDTCFFRWDLDFVSFVNYLENKYKNCDKVNIIAHACSDGEEVYSFVSNLIERLGISKAMKYLPVKAVDIEQEHINLAKRGEYLIKSFEKGSIDYYLGGNFTKYFKYLDVDKIKALPHLQNNVTFSKSDILEDVKTINFENTVLLARNFWRYLEDEDRDKLAKYLSQKMNKSSTLVIGSFDKECNVDRILYNYGFKESGIAENVFHNFK